MCLRASRTYRSKIHFNDITNQARGNRGGGQWGHNFQAVGRPPPQLWTVIVVHFCFCLFLHVNLGLSPKLEGQIRGV